MPRFILLLLVLCLWPVQLMALDLPAKHELDERQYRRFTLDNELKVMLVHDPKMNQSAAAMDVEVGSLADPAAHQGLAHFLEHMLFLGTRKYPNEKDYHSYLKSRGGSHNAYTSGGHTNYHFQIHHEAFEGALDRFSQFFIAPLFNPEFSTREKQAVHNEHQKNLMNDRRRFYHLLNRHYDPEHPAHHFATGDKDTLKDVDPQTLLSFYEQYYSANRMSLVLLSNRSLDWMEEQVHRYFKEVPNRKRKEIVYPTEFLRSSESLRVIEAKPVKTLRELKILFPLPGMDEHILSSPASLIGTLLGHEGENSLLSYLKNRNWATGLSAGAYSETANYTYFFIDITLTELGLAEVEQVLDASFGGILSLRQAGYPQHVFEEEKLTNNLDRVYTYRGEGTGLAMQLANNLNRYPMELAELVRYQPQESNPDLYMETFHRLVPETSLVMIVNPEAETDLVEAVYGTEYSYREDAQALERLKALKPLKEVALPKTNPFLPKKATPLALEPIHLIDEESLSLYYLQDTEFRRPKAELQTQFIMPVSRADIASVVAREMAISCIREQLNEIAYSAALAGIAYSIGGDAEKVKLRLTGFDDSLSAFLTQAVPHLTQLHLPKERFEALLAIWIQELNNFEKEPAYAHAIVKSRQLNRLAYHTPPQKLEYAKKLTYDRVAQAINNLWKGVRLEALVHGNMKAEAARKLTLDLWNGLQATAKEEELMETSYLDFSQPSFYRFVGPLETNNSAYLKCIHLGHDSLRIRTMARILKNFIEEPFYTEMRTRQQLGYAVWAFTNHNQRNHFLSFLIQSGTHTAGQVSDRVNAFLPQLFKNFAEMDQDAFDVLKTAVREKLLEKPKSIAKRAKILFHLAYTEDSQFDQTQEMLSLLKSISLEDMKSFVAEATGVKKKRGYDVRLFAKGLEVKAEEGEITDLLELKSTLKYAKKKDF